MELFHEYEPKALGELSRLQNLAHRVREKFDAGAAPSDLLLDVRILGAAYQSLEQALPVGISSGSLARHLHFLEYYLERSRPEDCRDDINDVCRVDLPKLEKAIRARSADQQHYDAELAEKVGRLLEERHLDSAIRKAFVILKERLVHSFVLAPDLDGADLVNAIFGSKGCLAGRIPEPERHAMRDLLAGLYGIFRNRYGHRDVEPAWFEVAAVLGMVNWALRIVDEYASALPPASAP